jgi:hypothetical protein
MPGSGPSRHFAAAQQLGRFWREADINRQAEPAGLVANDPKTDIWPRGSSLRKRRPTKDEMIQWFSRPHRDVAEYLHFWRETNTL